MLTIQLIPILQAIQAPLARLYHRLDTALVLALLVWKGSDYLKEPMRFIRPNFDYRPRTFSSRTPPGAP